MNFHDRIDAGKKLADSLRKYANDLDAIVIALPRGGVVVGYEIAKALSIPLDITCPRKIGAPINQELAIGAITETGEGILSEDLIRDLNVDETYIQISIEKEKKEAQSRLDRYRLNRPPRSLKDKRVILVDDGLATGATMRAAIKTVRSEGAKKIIMAIPVAPPETLRKLEREVDETVCLFSPSPFFAVGQFYEIFDQTSDEEVISILKKIIKL